MAHDIAEHYPNSEPHMADEISLKAQSPDVPDQQASSFF